MYDSLRKALVWLLAALLAFGMAAGAYAEEEEEGTNIEFEPTITSALDNSASEWYKTKTNRAMLTVLLSFDLMASDEGEKLGVDGDFLAQFLANGTYVCKDDELRLTLMGYVDDRIYWINYAPIIDYASINYTDFTNPSSTMIEMMLTSLEYDYEQNSLEAVLEVLKTVQDIVS